MGEPGRQQRGERGIFSQQQDSAVAGHAKPITRTALWHASTRKAQEEIPLAT
jgi:hypothetical protein